MTTVSTDLFCIDFIDVQMCETMSLML